MHIALCYLNALTCDDDDDEEEEEDNGSDGDCDCIATRLDRVR